MEPIDKKYDVDANVKIDQTDGEEVEQIYMDKKKINFVNVSSEIIAFKGFSNFLMIFRVHLNSHKYTNIYACSYYNWKCDITAHLNMNV